MDLGESQAIHDLKDLDKKFYSSAEGQKLMKEWHDFGKALKKAIKPTPNGVHINNKEIEHAEQEARDIEAQYKHLEHTHWNQDYKQAFGKVMHSKEARNLHGYVEHKWKPSREAKRGYKEAHELGHAIKENVKVSDIPNHWKKEMKDNMFLF